MARRAEQSDVDYQPPYTVAPPNFAEGTADFHTPQPVPPRPGDRVDGAAEVRGVDPLVVAKPEPAKPAVKKPTAKRPAAKKAAPKKAVRGK